MTEIFLNIVSVYYIMDFFNAHSEVSRAAVLEQLSSIPTLSHLAQHTAVSIVPGTTLVSKGKIWREAGDGAGVS